MNSRYRLRGRGTNKISDFFYEVNISQRIVPCQDDDVERVVDDSEGANKKRKVTVER